MQHTRTSLKSLNWNELFFFKEITCRLFFLRSAQGSGTVSKQFQFSSLPLQHSECVQHWIAETRKSWKAEDISAKLPALPAAGAVMEGSQEQGTTARATLLPKARGPAETQQTATEPKHAFSYRQEGWQRIVVTSSNVKLLPMSNLTDKFRLEQLQYLHLSGESSLSFLRNLLMVSSIVLPILSLSSPNLSLKGKADFLSHSSSHLDLGSGSYLSPGKTKIRAIKGAKKMDSLSHPPALHTGAVQAHRANWRLPQSWIHSVTAGNAHHEVAAMKTQIFVYDNGTSSMHSTSGRAGLCWRSTRGTSSPGCRRAAQEGHRAHLEEPPSAGYSIAGWAVASQVNHWGFYTLALTHKNSTKILQDVHNEFSFSTLSNSKKV